MHRYIFLPLNAFCQNTVRYQRLRKTHYGSLVNRVQQIFTFKKSFHQIVLFLQQVTGNEYLYGCAQQMAWWLEPWTATLAGLAFGLMVIHVVQMVLNSRLRSRMREYHRAEREDY